MYYFRAYFSRFFPALVLTILGAVVCALLLPHEIESVDRQIIGFPDSDVTGHLARPTIFTLLCFLPAIAALAYAAGGTLDRYLSRQFLGIFGICTSALFVVWLLMDLNGNLDDFLKGESPILTALKFYGSRSSAIILFLAPYSLLLSLLYSLGKLSASREIIAMIQTGRGLLRVTTPLIAAGVFCSLLCLGLNYHWAPISEGRKDEILEASQGKAVTEATYVLYRNANERRLWMVGAFPQDYERGKPLLNVEVTTTREDGTLETRLAAKMAIWNRENLTWTFEEPVVGKFTPGEPPEFTTSDRPLVYSWNETPWQLIKPGLPAEYLGIPDLNGWLVANRGNELTVNPAPYLTQWHYRWALPFTCLVTVLLAAPLAIHFSRRGAGGGVFLAVVLSALMLLVTSISLVLGEASIVRPALAAWLPNILFTLLGLYLFHRRIAGRPIYQRLRTALVPGTD
jgi:LPS export ABC transporter permease LptG